MEIQYRFCTSTGQQAHNGGPCKQGDVFLKGKMPTCFSAWAVAKDGLTAIEAIALLGKLDKSSCWRPELHEFGHQVSWPHAASALSGQLSRSMTIDVLFRAWACKVENEPCPSWICGSVCVPHTDITDRDIEDWRASKIEITCFLSEVCAVNV